MSSFKHRASALAASALALSLLFSGAARADENELLNYQCADQSGQKVTIVMGSVPPGHTGAQSTFFGAMQPMMILDQKWMAGATLATQRITEAHECTHHRLGHLVKSFSAFQQGKPLSFAEQMQLEFDADCGALQEVAEKYGYGKAEATEFYKYIQSTVRARVLPLMLEREQKGLACPALQ